MNAGDKIHSEAFQMAKLEILQDPSRPSPAPAEFAGQWVAWNVERTQIIANGRTIAEVHAALRKLGEPGALLERVRRLDELRVGRL
jgi:hypothetical protein